MSSIEAMQDLCRAGMDPKVAEALVIHLEKIINNRAASKADLSDHKVDMLSAVSGLRTEVLKAISELKNDIQSNKADTIKAVYDSKSSMLMWVVGLILIALFVNGAAIWAVRTAPVAQVLLKDGK